MENTVEILRNILSEYQAEHDGIQSQIEPLIKKQEYLKEKIVNYQRVLSLETGGGAGDSKDTINTGSAIVHRNRSSFPSAAAAIRYLIGKSGNEFTVSDIQKEFEANCPDLNFSRNSFHTIVKGMIAKGRAQQLRPGGGSSPATYTKIVQGRLI